jgi:hypothetical protein
MNITISGKEIELNERPKHKAVMQVHDIMTEWLMSKVDMTGYSPNENIESVMKKAMVKNPKLTIEVSQMQLTLERDQTIMLSTGFSYKELSELKDEMYEDDYHALFEKSRTAIGGTANDFFEAYRLGLSLIELVGKKNQLMTELERLQLEVFESQQVTSSATSTVPYEVKTSTSQD